MVKKLFAGGNTPLGFYSYYYDILDKRRQGRLYILKGGSGVGKGTFIRHFAEALEQIGEDITYYYCSGDSQSLDGACCERLNIAIIDGTAPHVVDPLLPGVTDEIVNLGMFLSHEKLLPHKAEIERGINLKAEKFKLSYELLSAAEKLDNIEKYFYNLARKDDAAVIIAEHITDRITGAEGFLIKKHEDLDASAKNVNYRRKCPAVRHCFGKAITPDGVVSYGVFERQNYNITELIANSDLEIHTVLSIVAKQLSDKFDVLLYHNPMRPLEILSLYIPETGDYICEREEELSGDMLAKLASYSEYGNKNYSLSEKKFSLKPSFDSDSCYEKKTPVANYSLVDIRAIISHETLNGRIDIVSEAKKEKDKLIALAIECMAEAKELHKGIEKYYIDAMDWRALESFRTEFIQQALGEIKGKEMQ